MSTPNENIYAPPKTAVEEVDTATAMQTPPFYVVSLTKFFALFFATFGLYQIVWFYLHWRRYKQANQADIWPVPRALFAVFFTHALLRAVDRHASRNEVRLGWAPSSLATAIVLTTIAVNVVTRLVENSVGSLIALLIQLALLGLLGHFSAQAQRAINRACGDPQGADNARFTLVNIVFLVLGGILWVLALIGVLIG